MTHASPFHEDGTMESRTQAVARRLRGELAERNISGLKLAAMTGLSQSLISRRRTGETAYTIDELDLICSVAGIDFCYVATGYRSPAVEQRNPRHMSDAGELVGRAGLEPATSGLIGSGSAKVLDVDEVSARRARKKARSVAVLSDRRRA